jgi:hypothetical protein
MIYTPSDWLNPITKINPRVRSERRDIDVLRQVGGEGSSFEFCWSRKIDFP